MSIERDYYMLVEGAKEVLRLNESELDTPVPDVTVALQGLIRHGSRTYITMSQKLMSDFINGDCDMARHLSLFATEDKKSTTLSLGVRHGESSRHIDGNVRRCGELSAGGGDG
ncbi:hypothetical protein ACLFLC_17655 [Providencia rettgeri]